VSAAVLRKNWKFNAIACLGSGRQPGGFGAIVYSLFNVCPTGHAAGQIGESNQIAAAVLPSQSADLITCSEIVLT
jgi:hypothetical protein